MGGQEYPQKQVISHFQDFTKLLYYNLCLTSLNLQKKTLCDWHAFRNMQHFRASQKQYRRSFEKKREAVSLKIKKNEP